MNELKNEIFKNSISTLKECSYDSTDKVYMTEFELEVVNFDEVKKIYFNNLGLTEETSKSVDSLLYLEDKILFIEFKNGSSNINNSVKNKAKDSLLIFNDLSNTNISFTRENIIYIVVYNKLKRPNLLKQPEKYDIMNMVGNNAKEPTIHFDLSKFKTAYFKEVYTYNEEEFSTYISKLISN